MKLCQVGVALLHADGQTDMKSLIIAFRNFVNAPKNKPDYKALTCQKNVIHQMPLHCIISILLSFTLSSLLFSAMAFVFLMSTR